MKKAKVVKSEARPGFYRLILNVTDSYNVGSIMEKGELRELMYEIKDLLDNLEKENEQE